MECKITKQMKTTISMCDNTNCLSVPAIFSVFMDMAGEHAEVLGCGADTLAEKGMFWLTVKTKIHINERPQMTEEISVETWPAVPGKIRCDRCYEITCKGKTAVQGRTEWAIIELSSGKLCKAEKVYGENVIFSEKTVCPEPFFKLSDDFANAEKLGVYRVASTDIDIGQHMNNAAYIRAMFGMLSCKETEALNVVDVEITFKTPCFENEELTVLRRTAGSITDIAMIKPDGRIAAVARLVSK